MALLLLLVLAVLVVLVVPVVGVVLVVLVVERQRASLLPAPRHSPWTFRHK